jgi:hypothetical protein
MHRSGGGDRTGTRIPTQASTRITRIPGRLFGHSTTREQAKFDGIVADLHLVVRVFPSHPGSADTAYGESPSANQKRVFNGLRYLTADPIKILNPSGRAGCSLFSPGGHGLGGIASPAHSIGGLQLSSIFTDINGHDR